MIYRIMWYYLLVSGETGMVLTYNDNESGREVVDADCTVPVVAAGE